MRPGNNRLSSMAGIIFMAVLGTMHNAVAEDNPKQVKNTQRIGSLEMSMQSQAAKANVTHIMLQTTLKTMQGKLDELEEKINSLESEVAFLRRTRK
ncbi:MAG: hypothetical protein OSA42_02355 [Porticoccaceae bacterium]|nr:hypothetical protein [Porticoccaceae bacterium]